MTEKQAVALRRRIDLAIGVAEEALHLADGSRPAPVEALRAAILELRGARLACDLRLEQKPLGD